MPFSASTLLVRSAQASKARRSDWQSVLSQSRRTYLIGGILDGFWSLDVDWGGGGMSCFGPGGRRKERET